MSLKQPASMTLHTADHRVSRGMLRARASVPAIPRTVARPALEARFDEAVERRLTLVSAGPGWGKTTAAARWAQGRGDVAWLTLEARDDAPTAFWSDVLAALRVSGAVPPGHPLDELQVPAQVSSGFLRRLFRAVELLPGPAVLVLDDAHVVTDRTVLAGIEDLLRFPNPLRLVLATRTDPVLPLHRLRAAGQLAEIVADDLAFDATEVMALAAAEGRPLSRADADRVIEETDGWAVGVRLRLDAAEGSSVDPRASAAEYLLAEVLERQDPALRTLLLQTSVPRFVCAELADAIVVGGVSGAEFARLTSNAFVSATGDGGWFRYHPLLRDMLRAQLKFEDPEAFDDAHRRTARWMVHHGEPRQALEHALAARDWELFGEVFVDAAGGELVTSEREAMLEVLRRVPYADVRPTSALELCAAAEALTSGRFGAARAHVAEARRLLGESPRASAVAFLGTIEAASGWGLGDVQTAVAGARAALDALAAAPWPFPAMPAYALLAGANHGVGRMLRGDVTGAAEELGDVARTQVGRPPSLAAVHARAYLSWGEVTAGALDQGERTARLVIDDAARWGWSSYVHGRMAYAAAGFTSAQRGDDDEASRYFAQGLSTDVGGTDPASTLALRLGQTLVAVSRGRQQAAALALDEAHVVATRTGVPPLLRDLTLRTVTEVQLLRREARPWLGGRPEAGDLAVAQVARARLMIASGRAGAALPLLREVLRHDGDDIDALTRVEALVACATALAHLSRTGVDDALAEALTVAGPDRLSRPFLAVRDPLLDERLARLVAVRPGALAATVRDRLGPPPTGPEPAPLLEPLTERELAMLAALPTMASNTEIADDFYVSVNTVKAHLKALYRKLDVGTRRDAVRRGRELGLLD